MGNKKCALLDTDFISKLHSTQKDQENRMIDRILEMPDYEFICHKQIFEELQRYDGLAIQWLKDKLKEDKIIRYDDKEMINLLKNCVGKNAVTIYLAYLKNACDLFETQFYDRFYGREEKRLLCNQEEFDKILLDCDAKISCDNNLGEIKTYTLQQILKYVREDNVYLFCSDDKKARTGLSNDGLSCISALASFYLLKENLRMPKEEAKKYFDSWMHLHKQSGQTSFKVHINTQAMQLMKMDGYDIFNYIYDGNAKVLKNGNLKIQG